jgi:hypothetical protein
MGWVNCDEWMAIMMGSPVWTLISAMTKGICNGEDVKVGPGRSKTKVFSRTEAMIQCMPQGEILRGYATC